MHEWVKSKQTQTHPPTFSHTYLYLQNKHGPVGQKAKKEEIQYRGSLRAAKSPRPAGERRRGHER